MASYQISFSFCKRFHIFAFLHVFLFFLFSSFHSGFGPTEAGGFLALARCSARPVMLSGTHVYRSLPRYTLSKVWFQVRNGRGPPFFLFTTPFLPGLVTNNRFSDRFGFSGPSIGHENLRPRFGILMMHFGLSYVVRYDFCCLLSCCCFGFEILIPKGFLNWSWTRISSRGHRPH